MRYIEEITISPVKNIKKYFEKLITILRIGNDQPKLTFMSAYTCVGYISKTETIITKYKIAAGPNDTSVILLKETNCPNNISTFLSKRFSKYDNCYEIIELIEYLIPDYINILTKLY